MINDRFVNEEFLIIVEGRGHEGDFIKVWNGSSTFAISEHGLKILRHMLHDIEIIQIKCSNALNQYYLLHFMTYRKKVDYSEVGNSIHLFRRKIDGKVATSKTYASESFRKRVESYKLTGFNFSDL